MKRYDYDIEILPEPATDGTIIRFSMVRLPGGKYVEYADVVLELKEIFDSSIVDVELWDELDNMDNGERVDVHITVMDLKRVRDIIRNT